MLILLAAQSVIMVAAIAYLWRRQRASDAEIARLRAELTSLAAVGARREGRVAEAAQARQRTTSKIVPLPSSTRLISDPAQERAPPAAPKQGMGEVAGGMLLAIAAVSPALGFLFASPSMIAAIGVLVGAAMMLLALRAFWSAGAWAGAVTATAWALVGMTLGVETAVLAGVITAAGLAALVQARLRDFAPGAALVAALTSLLLVLGAQSAMFGPYGIALAVLVSATALVGAHERFETLHVAAFAAALVGLFLLSGQSDAAIWFTPAAAWMGALFFGAAAVRVPYAGARAATVAATGALAPMLAVGALHQAQHALVSPLAAAASFFVVGALIAALLALTARRYKLTDLKLTTWMLACSAFMALAAAIFLALPSPLEAPAFALLGVGLAALIARKPLRIWAVLACTTVALCVLSALGATRLVLAGVSELTPWTVLALAPAASTALLVYAKRLVGPTKAITGILEAAALVLFVIAAHLLIRIVCAGEAVSLDPVDFVEATAHISMWLVASLAIAAGRLEWQRTAMSFAFSALGFIGAGAAALAWFTPYWAARQITDSLHAPLGFLLLSAMFWAHWALWRARAKDFRTRASLASAALMMGAAIVLHLADADIPRWAFAMLSSGALMAAIALNFAPGVTAVSSAYERAMEPAPRRRSRHYVRN